ncbi:MAG: hypothetical protein M3Q71_04495 [Chloroflexota bacterium]|nr:hypothetical protein [Chloroflexota bacterium]MDP9469915.1 hypothetical protein [Chloroflexota bacterium]
MDNQDPNDDTPFPASSSRRQLLRSLVGVAGVGAVLALAGCGGGGGGGEDEDEDEDEGDD